MSKVSGISSFSNREFLSGLKMPLFAYQRGCVSFLPQFLLFLTVLVTLVFISSTVDSCPTSVPSSLPKKFCPSSRYSEAARPPTVDSPPGLTRSVVFKGSYALLAPESRVKGGKAKGWKDVEVVWLIGGAMGAKFGMCLVGGTKGRFTGGDHEVERFIYVLEGAMKVYEKKRYAGSYIYVPPDVEMSLDMAVEDENVGCECWFVVIERLRRWDKNNDLEREKKIVLGHEDDVEIEQVPGEDFQLQRLLPKKDPYYGFNIHLMDFKPGEYLNVKEVHYNEHGLLLLEGQGIYMLGGQYFPVRTGDVIFMGPYVVQFLEPLENCGHAICSIRTLTRTPLLIAHRQVYKAGTVPFVHINYFALK